MNASRRTILVALVPVLTACRTVTEPAPAPPEFRQGAHLAAQPVLQDPAPSPEPLGPDASLGDYVRLALSANPGLEAARQNWLAELEQLPQVASLPDPVVSARYYIEEVETRVGPQEWGVGLSQKFPWIGKRGRLEERAAARAEAARARYDAKLLATIEEVKTAWYELFYLERSIATVRENGELLAHLEEVVRTRYSSGDATYADLIRAQVERDRLQDRLSSLEDRRRPQAAQLNRTLHREPDAQVPRTTELAEPGSVRTTADLRDELEDASPELRILRHELLASAKNIELAELARRPDLTFGIEYIATGSAEASGISGSGDDPLIASLSFNVPLWSARNRALEREARARHRGVAESIGSEHDRLLAELETELFRARDATRQMTLYANSLVPKARQSMEATETAFRSGQSGFLDLVDAERLLLEFELNLERARTDRALAIARLERLVGGPVTDEMGASEPITDEEDE
jgi:cobalt-zinc-cadmium efflux system outer membrane protein